MPHTTLVRQSPERNSQQLKSQSKQIMEPTSSPPQVVVKNPFSSKKQLSCLSRCGWPSAPSALATLKTRSFSMALLTTQSIWLKLYQLQVLTSSGRILDQCDTVRHSKMETASGRFESGKGQWATWLANPFRAYVPTSRLEHQLVQGT